MSSTGAAKLLEFQPLGGLFLILCGGIIPVLTFVALQRNDISHDPIPSQYKTGELSQDVGHGASPHRPSAFPDRKPQPLLHRDRRNQLNLQCHVVSRHHHLRPFR